MRYSDYLRAGRFGDRIPVRDKFSAPVQTGPGSHLASFVMCTGSVSWGQSGRGVALTTHLHLALRVKKEQRYTSSLPLGLHDLFSGELYRLTLKF